MVKKGDTPKMRKEKFVKLLEGFKIEGTIKYPAAYAKQKNKITEKNGIYLA
jgi:hypothetical protein